MTRRERKARFGKRVFMHSSSSCSKRVRRTLVTVLGFAAVSAVATLGVALPRTTFADGDEGASLGTVDGTRRDHVVVDAKVERDAKSSTGWSLVIDAENDGDKVEACAFKTALERSYVTPMARVPSEISTLLTRVESVSVPPHGKVHVTREVPAWIVPQLVTAERMEKARVAETKRIEKSEGAWDSPVMRAAYPSFHVAVLEPDAEVPKFRTESAMMPPTPLPPPPFARRSRPPTPPAIAERSPL